MKENESKNGRRLAVLCLAGLTALGTAGCGNGVSGNSNVIVSEEKEEIVINFFSPMEKTDPDVENVARTASDLTIIMAEEKLGVEVAYDTYTAENYQDKTYDEVTIDRVCNNMDDIYLLNPDTVLKLGEEGRLADLSGLGCVENLRDVVKTANVVDGKLVAIPQEIVSYGLFINKDM